MFAFRCGIARGQALVGYVVAGICLGLVILTPALFGDRAERVYRDSVGQLASTAHAITLDSYQRGWFSSRAIVSIATGRGAITLVQHVHHGPFGFYNGWHPAFPVAAIVDTDPPPRLQDWLNEVFGDAPIIISTVVEMRGALNTYISRTATEHTDPARGFTAKFGGFNSEVSLSQDAYVIRGDAPGITAMGAFGEAGMADLTIRGRSQRDASGLWLGNKVLSIKRMNYSIVSSGTHPSSSGLVQNIGFDALSELRNGELDIRETVSIGSIAGGALKLGPITLVAGINNIPPAALGQFTSAAVSISRSTPDQRLQLQMLQQKVSELLAAIVKESPLLSIDLHAGSPNGEAVGKATFGFSADLANDPLISNPDRKGMIAQAWNKYGHASVEIVAPQSFLAQLANANQLQRLEQNGIVVRDGDNYICLPTYKDGEWLVNGRKINVPAPPVRSNPTSRSS